MTTVLNMPDAVGTGSPPPMALSPQQLDPSKTEPSVASSSPGVPAAAASTTQPSTPPSAPQPPAAGRSTAKRSPSRDPFFPSTLVFSPLAWLQLNFLCHAGDTEIGCFGIAAHDHPFYIESLGIIRQRCSAVSVEFNDHAVADFFDEQIDEGRTPELFARVWIHTHPGTSAEPSGVDEDTFKRVFGACDWAVMFILAKGGQVTCRLRVHAGKSGGPRLAIDRELRVLVDWEEIVTAEDLDQREKWREEYARNVEVLEYSWPGQRSGKGGEAGPRSRLVPPPSHRSEKELLDWFDALSPEDQRVFMAEMRGLPDQADCIEDDPRWAEQFEDEFPDDRRDPWDEMAEAEYASYRHQHGAERRMHHAE